MTSDKDKKAALRQERLALRDSIAADLRFSKSLAMAELAGDAFDFFPGTVISGFFPIRSEADIRPLMDALKRRGAKLCVPAILDRQTIVFRELVDGVPLVDTGFCTRGPGPDAPILDPDILLVPLSAFDETGHRIGYGAGHYDRAIDRLHKKGMDPLLIGIAFDCQEVASVPAEPHDVGLNAIITESGFRYFKRRIG